MSLSGNSSGKISRSNENYFSIDDIIATQEKIPCKFEVAVPHLGYLDQSSDSEDVAVGTKLELPYWLAQSLCGRRKHTVSVELPKVYRESYREIFDADATVVDLHKLGPYFYLFGTRLLHFEHPDSADIAKNLLQTFQTRFRMIMDMSQNSFNEDVTQLTQKLDETERTIFDVGQQGLNDFQQWETRQVDKLTTSMMVANHRKRKRAQVDDGQE
ncbi:hypothetical protein NP493_84g05066 [Ridgeia piscesae]|uniref:DNA replication complex GINS protein PSF3 n=1 Tax=Ridgeia piscesae TaxID=27915 RepID=A0AAD9P8U5_RIDPI|nr:hypothetical protein NP493_84g05066 [Ridgeia piscesae]